MTVFITIYLLLGMAHGIGGLRLLKERQPRRHDKLCWYGKLSLFCLVTLLWVIPFGRTVKRYITGK